MNNPLLGESMGEAAQPCIWDVMGFYIPIEHVFSGLPRNICQYNMFKQMSDMHFSGTIDNLLPCSFFHENAVVHHRKAKDKPMNLPPCNTPPKKDKNAISY